MERVLSAITAIVLGVGVMVLYFYGSNLLLDALIKDQRDETGEFVSREKQREAIRPWLFLLPALSILFVYLVYPLGETIRLSLLADQFVYIQGVGEDESYYVFQRGQGEDGVDLLVPSTQDGVLIPESNWEAEGVESVVRRDINLDQDFRRIEVSVFGLDNYTRLIKDIRFWESVQNNLLWIIVVPAFSVAFGLVIAVLADNVSWGNIAKSIIFMPMAISMVGASVIWKFVYSFDPDIGIINAVRAGMFGMDPIDLVQLRGWNNFFLMVILIWIQSGFAMVLLGAALRSVPEETLEAARIDGANEIAIFFRIMIPQILSTIFVVWTTILITVLKVFDIVLAMTNGDFGTQVLANYMYDMQFTQFDSGYASLLALVMVVAVIPVMVINVRRFLAEERLR